MNDLRIDVEPVNLICFWQSSWFRYFLYMVLFFFGKD